MKKRVIAILCTLALVLGVCAVVATDVTAATDTFQVGFSRVDINPWVDPTDHSQGLLQLPMRGLGNTIHRLSSSEFIDDNGNGVIDEEDGLFATCLAITDDDGDTVLMLSVAIIGGFDKMVDEARPAIVAALKEKGVDIPEENIQIQGTHTHSSIDLSQYASKYKDSTTQISWLFNQDGDKVDNTEGVTYGDIYANFEVWFPYLIDQLTASAVEAVADQDAATMSKGEIDAGDASGKVMNTVRHYTREATSTGETYVWGSNFNGSGIGYDKTTTSDDTANAYPGTHELAEANDTMYCLSFNFSDSSKDPIALVNWRAHTTQNGTGGTYLNVSSDYVNCMSRVLSDAGYRSIFIQGAAGNVNPVSRLYGSWANTHSDADGDGIWEGSEIRGNLYGEVLGQVAAQCLQNNMSQVTTGDIKVTTTVFNADAKTYTQEIEYDAAVAAALCFDQGWSDSAPFVYPNDLYDNYIGGWTLGGVTFGGDELINFLSTEQQEKAAAYKEAGQTYVIASTFHAADIKSNYQETGTHDVDLTAFVLGDNVAFVTAPGEMYDRYNSNVNWDQLKDMSQSEIYALLSATNEWDKLLGSNVGGSYGTPFVMGYANSHIGYLPNYIAYEYNAGSAIAAVGSYEAHTTELNQGECEQIMDVYAGMLKSLVSSELTDSDLYHTAYCAACEATVNWAPISSEYNNNSGTPGLGGGHYYLVEDVTSSQKYVVDGDTVCIDLNGHTFTGSTRAFVLESGETLNIMDTSEAGTGTVQGHGGSNIAGTSPFGGGTVYLNSGATCNLYSGTLTQAFTETSGTAYGGVVEVKSDAVFNMYGGTITGGKAYWTGLNKGTDAVSIYGGNVYVYGGEFNMYDGTITDGTAQAYVVETTAEDGTVTATKNTAYGGNIYVRASSHTDADGNTYYTGSFNLYGGTITGGQAVSNTSENSNTANSYGGNVFVGKNAHLNLHGGTITGGSAGYRGDCVYTETGYATLSGSGSADQIWAYSTGTTNVTVFGYYTGTAQIRTRNTAASTAAGTVIGVSDNAVLNTTGLTAYGSGAVLVVSGDDLVIGSTSTCGCCGETVVMNELTQTLWDAYQGNLPTAHYKLAENITAALGADGVEMSNAVCIDLNGYTLSSTTGRLYKILSGGTVRICDSSEAGTGTVVTAGLPSGTSSMYGGLFYVSSGATLELCSGTLTMEQGENMYVHRGGIVYVAGTFNMSGGTVQNGVCNQADTNSYGGNIAIADGGVVNMSGGTVKDGYAFSGNTSKEGAGGNVQIFAGGTLNMSGGTINAGTAEGEKYGPCIRQSPNSKVVLSGDASPEEVSFRMGCLDISGTYTGTTVLRLASGTLSSGNIVGAAVDANIDNANITIYNSDMKLYVADTNLVAAEETTCSACGETAVWLPLSLVDSATWSSGLTGGHYYLDTEEVAVPKYVKIPADNTVCLDLRGNNITATVSRLFYIDGTLHLLDTEGDGVAKGTGGTSSGWGGGTVSVNSGGTFYLHSGNLTQAPTDTYKAANGGVMLVNGTFYMSGGSISGGTATTGYGGNIYIKNGSAVISGGSISGGTAATGNCVYVADGKNLTLSGDANVDEICFGGDSADTLTVSGTYTGTVALYLSVTAENGLDIGNSSSANIKNAAISVVGSDLAVKVSGSDLVLSSGGVNIVDAQGGVTPYGSLSEALADYAGTTETLVLMDSSSQVLTLSQNADIDLNGNDLSGITLDEGVSLTVMDSQTADYTVEDGIFGKVSGVDAAAADGYVKYTHEDGTVSFHKIDTAVESLSLRPTKAGIYYGGTFKGDEYVAQLVQSFGVALSITGTPVEATGIASHSLYSQFGKAAFEPGNEGEYTSTVLVNILNANNGSITNRRNGTTPVYGCSYIQLADGTYITGNTVSYTLQWVVEWVNDNWASLTQEQQDAVIDLYEQFPAVLGGWKVDNILAAIEEKETSTLKVLLLGNSHGLDTTNLLMEVFENEGTGQYDSVVLGAMYRSGCRMDQHSAYATANTAAYSYYKNVSNDGEDAWTITKNSTLRDALADEQWDIVVLQEMNVTAGQEALFQDDDISTVINYVCQSLGYKPELKWHLVWANPEIPSDADDGYSYYLYDAATRDAYIAALSSDSGEADGSENEGYTGGATTTVPWIYEIAMPTDKTISGVTYPGSLKWEYNYKILFESSRNGMYQMMVDNVRNYVVGNTTYGIGEEDVIASGTAVQYAINTLGMTEQELYRDYTHMNDYGRVMTAYLWYAELMGLESISQVNLTTVAESMRCKGSTTAGNLTLDDAFKQKVIDAVNYTLENTYGTY